MLIIIYRIKSIFIKLLRLEENESFEKVLRQCVWFVGNFNQFMFENIICSFLFHYIFVLILPLWFEVAFQFLGV